MSIDIKERIQAVIDYADKANPDIRVAAYRLCAILRDLEAEPPKPTGEPIAFKRPCSTCGHQGNIFATYLRAAGFKIKYSIKKGQFTCSN